MKILFYGFGHGHIFGLYQKAVADPEIEIAACIEEDEEMAAVAEDALGIKILRGGYDEWLETDIDAVAIGKAFTLRGEAAIKALRAGKHVIADKPICTKLSEIDEIEKLSSQNGLEVACMLEDGVVYSDIVKKTGASTATISRVNRALNYGAGGYESILKKLDTKESEEK